MDKDLVVLERLLVQAEEVLVDLSWRRHVALLELRADAKEPFVMPTGVVLDVTSLISVALHRRKDVGIMEGPLVGVLGELMVDHFDCRLDEMMIDQRGVGEDEEAMVVVKW